MLTALMLSAIHTGLDPRHIEEYRNDILEHHYNPLPFDADDIPQLVELMGHDKKKQCLRPPSSVLLSAPGEPVAGIAVEPGGYSLDTVETAPAPCLTVACIEPAGT